MCNITELLKRKARLDAQDRQKRTPIFIAVTQGHLAAAQFLLSPAVTLTSEEGATVLHQAAFYGNLRLLRELLRYARCRSLIEAKDSDGKQPIHKAVWGDSKPYIVEYFLTQGIDPEVKNDWDYTPLHWAAKHGHLDSAMLLVDAGASWLAVNANGDTPLDLALKWGEDDIVHYCLKTEKRLSKKIQDPIFRDPEGYYYKCLMNAKRENLIEEQMVQLVKLSLVYQDKNKFLEAAKLLNSALAILQKHHKNDIFEAFLLMSLERLERKFLKTLDIKATRKDYLSKYRKRLQDVINNNCDGFKYRSKSTDLLVKNLTQEYKKLLGDVVVDAQSSLGDPPAKWTCMGLGSMAKEEMYISSKVQFAFVVEKITSDVLDYFRNLSILIELKIINLGKTSFPVFQGVDPEQASPILSGFCMANQYTPLGMLPPYELIGTPENFALFQTMARNDVNMSLSEVMNSTCYVVGDQELIKRYYERTNEVAEKKSKTLSHKTNRQKLAELLLKKYLQRFMLKVSQEPNKRLFFDVKEELYNPFQKTIGALALYYQVKDKNTLAQIDGLAQLKVFSSEGATQLKEAFNRILALRFETETFYRNGKEFLYVGSSTQKTAERLYMNESHIFCLQKVYNIFISFHRCAMGFIKNKSAKALRGNYFSNDSHVSRGYVFKIAQDYKKAKQAYSEAIAANAHDPDVHLYLGDLEIEKETPQQQLKRSLRALELATKKYGENHASVAISYKNLGSVCQACKDYKQARIYYEKGLKFFCKLYGERHPSVVTSYNNLGTVCSDLRDLEKAVTYYDKALKLGCEVCSSSDPLLVNIYNNLGAVLIDLGKTKEAINCLKKSLKFGLQIYGDHPNTARCYRQLGCALTKLGDVKQAVEHYRQAFLILCRLGKKKDPKLVKYLQDLIASLKLLESVARGATIKSVMSSCIFMLGKDHKLTQQLKALGGDDHDRNNPQLYSQ